MVKSIESKQEFGSTKAALLTATFEPIERGSFAREEYPAGAVCFRIPATVETDMLLAVVDRYTADDDSPIIHTKPGNQSDERWLIIAPKTLATLLVNLRTKSPVKYDPDASVDFPR